MKTFRNSQSWINYRRILADEFDIELKIEPRETYRSLRGHEIRVDEWLPPEQAKGTLILVHGGGGNGRLLAPFAELATGLGWRVLAADLPGYGLSKTAISYRDEFSEWPAVIADVADQETGPVVLMGLSMGGLTAVLAAQQSSNVRGVIATTLIDLSDPEVFIGAAKWRWLGRLSLYSIRNMPWLFDRFVLPLSLATPLKAMSHNKLMQAYFAADPLLGSSWKRARFFRTVHQHRIDRWDIGCPLLLVHPGADLWTPTALSLVVFNKIIGRKDFRQLSNGAHLPLEQPAYEELKIEMRGFLDKVVALSISETQSQS